ncbi:MAG TPA: 16S rRNA (adenine(1518)-N(6)/adenine(1519)-N(6))-dimethyltransferase RsmA [Steroidobacteraceae bacterium]|nr:16S rRNA (adenine(1518)-N(6)/adenine(1519)-N(6))-dimethyltransferase RsmA [Steroidobacteraceae bacterium]
MSRAKKRLGQHFLHDPGTIARIVRAVSPQPGQRIVEIGPGRGAITVPLLEVAGRIDVVEIDADVIPLLEARCAGHGELRVHLADALRFDLLTLRGAGDRLRLVGNLPYNVSTPLLFHFVDQLDAIEDMHFMLQKEVVDRIAAKPGSRDYGRLTVMLAPKVGVRRLFDIGTGAFSPPPRVVSSFFALHPHREPPFPIGDPRIYARVVSAAFGQRRKTLRNSLAGMLTARAIEAAGVDPGARPETLAPQQFAALAAHVPAD